MATDPNEPPAHKIPKEFPLPPGYLPTSTESPTMPPQPQLPDGASSDSYKGEIENEDDDPVGKPPRM